MSEVAGTVLGLAIGALLGGVVLIFVGPFVVRFIEWWWDKWS